MALLFMDGFGHIDNNNDDYPILKWNTFGADPSTYVKYDDTYGSDGGWGLMLNANANSYVGKYVEDKSEIIIGFRLKHGTLSSISRFMRLMTVGSEQLDFQTLPNGSISVDRDGTVIGLSSVGVINVNVWAYIEVRVVFSTTVGELEVLVNGTEVINETGLNTCAAGTEHIDEVRIHSSSVQNNYFDDLYICDTTGTENNDFLGDVSIKTLYPVADGTNSDFTPSTGVDNYATIDEPQLTADTDWNIGSTIGDKDTFDMTTLAGDNTVMAVQVTAAVENTTTGTIAVRPMAISGSTPAETEGDDYILSQTIKGAMHIFEKEPVDDVDWTVASVNSAEFGIKIQS